MEYLNLASIRVCTEAEGPGKRFAIWVQGCKKRCLGCCNVQMQEIKKNIIVSTDDVIKIIEKAKVDHKIEGITLVGGEPFLQAQGLYEIAKWAKENKLTVLIFTGYEYNYLKTLNNEYVNKLLELTDILIDGPFIMEQYDQDRNWAGSSNQNIYFLTDAYKKGIEYNKDQRAVEILVSENELSINGWPYEINL